MSNYGNLTKFEFSVAKDVNFVVGRMAERFCGFNYECVPARRATLTISPKVAIV